MTTNEANRLIHEKSPYLLQHAHNPVDWYPWGDEAFQKAKEENKPIFLSIGYSTCHWCHVMERESFEDEEMAKVLNERFVSIKVDREERPDIDSIYMRICQQMTGHGGWPLNIFMTPDQIPFYAGTYFPPKGRYGLPSFYEVVTQLSKTFHEDSEQIEDVIASVNNALEKSQLKLGEKRLQKDVIERAYQAFAKLYDEKHAGFGDEPKFPSPQNLMFLLHYHVVTGDREALKMVEETLHAMADGGLWDHIGFGFTRYSTDQQWLVPHFEKMLYDNALLLIAYTEAYQLTKKPFYKEIAESIIEFVSSEMTSDEGGFYSAIDADSEGVEGRYYVWKIDEIREVLQDDLADLFIDVYNITHEGNFEGSNIPNLIAIDLDEKAQEHGLSRRDLDDELEQARTLLYQARKKRVYPHLDDKVLTSWNAMMIAALAKASAAFQTERPQEMAQKAIDFIERKLFVDGRLMARYRDQETKYNGYLDDYAYLAWSYIELYETTHDVEYLQRAKQLTQDTLDLFWDEDDGGFFFVGHDSETLIDREKEIQEGASPSGNSITAVNLAKLFYLTGDTSYSEKLEKMYHLFYPIIQQHPYSSPYFLKSLLLTEFPSKEIVLLSQEQEDDFTLEYQSAYTPQSFLLIGKSSEELAQVAPFVSEYRMINEQPTIYVCENFSCQAPTNDLEGAMNQIMER